MNHLLRFLSRLALDALKGIGYGCLLAAFLALFGGACLGIVWLAGYITVHSTNLTQPTGAKGSAEMNFGMLVLMGLIVVAFVGSFGWEAFKALRQRWRETA